MKILLSIFFIFTLCSCSTIKKDVGCNLETSAAAAISQGIVKQLSCTNQAQIQSDLLGYLGAANLCSSTNSLKGPIGDVGCPLAVGAVMGAINNVIPSTWGCSPTASTAGLASSLTKICEQSVSF